jgi:hypothetical protein
MQSGNVETCSVLGFVELDLYWGLWQSWMLVYFSFLQTEGLSSFCAVWSSRRVYVKLFFQASSLPFKVFSYFSAISRVYSLSPGFLSACELCVCVVVKIHISLGE